MNIQFDIDPKKFQDELAARIHEDSGLFTLDIIGNLVVEQFRDYLDNMKSSRIILDYELIQNLLGRDPFSLRELLNTKPVNIHFFSITLTTHKDDKRDFNLIRPNNLVWMDDFRIWKQEEITNIRSIKFTFWSIGLPVEFLFPVAQSIDVDKCQCQVNLLTAQAFDWLDDYPTEISVSHRISKHGHGITMSWVLRYICRVCGNIFFCECFHDAINIFTQDVLSLPKINKGKYEEGYWPTKYLELCKKAKYREELCHICRDIPLTWIGKDNEIDINKFSTLYYPYIIRTALEHNIDKRNAENEIRELLGYPKIGEGWVSEMRLLKIVREIFPSNNVIHQGQPKWLGLLRFDIFIPSMKLAIEYQGKQHFEPVVFFGGEESFKKTQANDKRKAVLCTDNGITLIYFRYDEPLTRNFVEKKIHEFIRNNRDGGK